MAYDHNMWPPNSGYFNWFPNLLALVIASSHGTIQNLTFEDVTTLIGLLLGTAILYLDNDKFVASILPNLEKLETIQRVQFISEKLRKMLPTDVREHIETFVAIPQLDKQGHARKPKAHEILCGWGIWFKTDVIGIKVLGNFLLFRLTST